MKTTYRWTVLCACGFCAVAWSAVLVATALRH